MFTLAKSGPGDRLAVGRPLAHLALSLSLCWFGGEGEGCGIEVRFGLWNYISPTQKGMEVTEFKLMG